MVDLLHCLENSLFSDISLIYYYINIRPSIIFCYSSGEIYFSLGISLSSSFVTVSELLCGELHETFAILSVNLLPIKSLIAYTVF